MGRIFYAAAIAAAISVPTSVQAGYSFTTGAEYTEGDYGTDVTTSSWYIPFTLGYSGEDYALSITVPYVTVNGSTEVTGVRSSSLSGKGDGKTSSTSTTDKRTDSGLGDITLKVSYQLLTETATRPWLGVTGKVKLGTASKRDNLGTGENDYAVQLDLAKGAIDGYLGYLFLGDTSAVNYDDIFYGAIGFSFPLGTQWRGRGEYYAEQEAVSGVDAVQEVSLSFDKPLGERRTLRLYVINGLSDSSPDWGAGVMLNTTF